jgi:regulator of PEP synthase PpsR (kinase-PPPase family)
MKDFGTYHSRIDAVNFTLDVDDGLSVDKYALADLILVGVSRSGKTPTSLYMAMQYGLRVANYPLTPEDFEKPGLPRTLLPHLDKLWGLTLSPERLGQIRAERRPNSVYASLETCASELKEAETRMRAAGIPVVDSTHRSVEEIAALIKQSLPSPPDQEI